MSTKRARIAGAVVAVCIAATVQLAVDTGAAASPHVASTHRYAPPPQNPNSPDIPSAGQLLEILNTAQDPNIPFADKSDLVEGGLSPVEAHLADVRMKQAVAHGELPLTGAVANVRPSGAHSATADVTISGPKLTPVTQTLTFVDQGRWKLSRSSLLLLMQESSASGS